MVHSRYARCNLCNLYILLKVNCWIYFKNVDAVGDLGPGGLSSANWVASEVGLVGWVASEAESDPSLVIVQNKFNRKIPFQPIC